MQKAAKKTRSNSSMQGIYLPPSLFPAGCQSAFWCLRTMMDELISNASEETLMPFSVE